MCPNCANKNYWGNYLKWKQNMYFMPKKEINYIKSFFILVYRMFILDDMLKIVHIRDMTLILKTVCGKFSHSMNYLQKQN